MPSSATTSTTQTFSSPTYPPTATSNNITAPSISPQEDLDTSISPPIISTAITNSTNNIGGESSSPPTSGTTGNSTQGGSSNSLSPTTINENTSPTYSPTIINFPTSNNSSATTAEGSSASSPTSFITGSSSIPTSILGEGGINSNVPTPSLSQTDIIGNGTLAPTPSISSEIGSSLIPTPFEDVLSNGTLTPTPGGTSNNTLLPTPNGTTTITEDINGTSIISGDTNSSASPTPYPTLSLPDFGTYSPTTFAVGGDDEYSYKWPTMSPSLGDGSSSSPTFYGTGAPYYTYDASGTDAPTTFNESSSPTMAGSSEGSSSVSSSPTEGGTASGTNTTTLSPGPTPSSTNGTSSDAPTLVSFSEVSSLAPSESVSGESTLSPVPTPSLTGSGVNTTAPTSVISTSLPTLFGENSEPTAAPMSSTVTESPTSTEPTASQTNPPSVAVTIEATTSSPTARATAELIITVVPPGPDDDIIESIPDEELPPPPQQQEEESFGSYSVGEDIPDDISPPEVGATHYADVHNKESEENEIPHFEGHVKMSAENTISLPPQDNGISPDLIDGQISFRHHEMDHMIAEGYSTADEVEEDINSSLLHVRRSHISAEGQEYERFKKEFHHVGGISLEMFSTKENEDIYQEELMIEEEFVENSANKMKVWLAVLLMACTWIMLTI